MTEKAGFIQGPPDIGTGKRIANLTVTLPAGTQVVNADGSTTTLAADAVVYIQKVALSDSKGNTLEDFGSEAMQAAVLLELKAIRHGISVMIGQPLSGEQFEDD